MFLKLGTIFKSLCNLLPTELLEVEKMSRLSNKIGDPGWTRTINLPLRRRMLHPIKLRDPEDFGCGDASYRLLKNQDFLSHFILFGDKSRTILSKAQQY